MENKENKKSCVYLSEYVDKNIAHWLLHNVESYPFEKAGDNGEKTIKETKEYCREILKSSNGTLKKTYYNNDGHGRMFVKGLGLQKMKREIRALLTYRNYVDLDIINCQPSILYSLCLKHNIEENEYLKKYIDDRDNIYENFKKNNSELTKDYFKEFFIISMYGANFEKPNDILNYFKNKLDDNNFKFVCNFYKQIDTIRRNILNREEYKNIVLEQMTKDENLQGSALSLILQNEENNIINSVRTFLKKKGYEIAVLIFDGCLIKNDIPLTNKILIELQKYINLKLNMNVRFTIKKIIPTYIPKQEELTFKEEIIINNDKEACDVILKILNNDIIKCDNEYFYRKFKNTNIYEKDVSNNNNRINDYLVKIISEQDIKKVNENGTLRDYGKTTQGAILIAKMIKSNLVDNMDFKEKLFSSNLLKLCFLNGYYDIKEKKFKEYDNETFTISYVKKNFCETIDNDKMKLLNDKIINKILPYENDRNLFLRWLSRGIFGAIDKTWGIGLGNRNTGKSVLTSLLDNTFNNYVKTFDALNLTLKENNSDTAKNLSWLCEFQYSRLNFSNELKCEKSDKKATILDGDLIKSISSGIDKKTCRKNYQNEEDIKIQGRMCLNMNQMVELNPTDASENLVIFEFTQNFVDKLEENHILINKLNETEEENEQQNKIRYHLKDKEVRDILINDEDIQMSLIHLLINNFGDEIINEKNKELINEYLENNNDATKIIKDNFIFTLSTKDKIKICEFNEYLADSNIKIKKSKLKMFLEANGIKTSNHPQLGKCYTGIKFK